ncbi:hypothetical protein GCM10010451_14460 [Streptomyces virens]|uniref:Uncharacterized protein n=1 Tax=Streptomyces virens TaxID=285572 RepID=A0ABP6P9V9_9ACTN
MDPRLSDTAPGHGRSDNTPATASRTAAASAGTAALGSGGTPGVGTSASRPATHTGTPLPPVPAPCTAPPAAERRVRPGDLRAGTVPAQDVVPVTVVPDAVRQCVVEQPATVGVALQPHS